MRTMPNCRLTRARLAVLTAVCALSGLAALSAPTAALAAKKKSCPTAGNTVAQNASVRVYSKTKNGDLDPLLACRFKDGKPFGLDAFVGRECQNLRRVDQVVLAGDMIAFEATECELETANSYLTVWSAKKRKVIRKVDGGVVKPAVTSSPGDGYTDITDLVVKSDGAVAWIGVGGYQSKDEPDNVEVRRITAAGKNELLDTGLGTGAGRPGFPDFKSPDFKSLALARNGRVYWTNGEVTKSAAL